jgi:hypothetical protein
MNNQEKFVDDLLKQYTLPEKDMKTPEGFTSKIMNRIQFETIAAESKPEKNLVPLITGLVIILLLAAALIVPWSQAGNFSDPVLNAISQMVSQPATNLSSMLQFTVPSVTIYVMIGIFVLTFFDKALHSFFKKEK